MRFRLRHSRSPDLRHDPAHPARAYRTIAAAALILAVLLAVGGCGSGGGGGTTTSEHSARDHRPSALTVYVSLPFNGPQAPQGRSVLNGIKLALANLPNRKAGAYRLKLRTYNDAGIFGHGWTENRTARNARHAATNPDTILYIGDLDSGASAISIPILKQAGIPQISPGSPATSLTGASSATGPSTPSTFLQLVPTDMFAATGNLLALHKLGCKNAVVVGDGGGQSLIQAMKSSRSSHGVHLTKIGKTSLAPKTSAEIASYVASAHARGECVFYSGVPSPAAVSLIRALRASLPASAAVLGSSQLCNASWARAVMRPSGTETPADARTTAGSTATVSTVSQRPPPETTTTKDAATTTTGATTTGSHGSSPPADTGLWCTSPTPDLHAPGLARDFLESYERRYHRAPDLPAIFGYETMRTGIRVIRSEGVDADSRQSLLEGLHALCVKESPLGPFAFDTNGSSTLTAYSLYKVVSGGALSFDQWLLKQPAPEQVCLESSR